MDIEKLLNDNGEVEFDYKGRHYFLACYCIKQILKKGHVEYWLMERLEENQEKQVFDTIDDLLDANIEGEKLRSILDSIKKD